MNMYSLGAAPQDRLGLILGSFYGFLTDDDSELELRVALPQGYLEDYERSLNYFVRHGIILRFADHQVVLHSAAASEGFVMNALAGGTHNRETGCKWAARKLADKFCSKFCRVETWYCNKVGTKKNAVFLPHLKPLTRRFGPSCMCGRCCFCWRRDGVVSLREARAGQKWCRFCRCRQRSLCSRSSCHGRRCVGAHCICGGRCSCGGQLQCPF